MKNEFVLVGCKVEFKYNEQKTIGVVLGIKKPPSDSSFLYLMDKEGELYVKNFSQCKVIKEDVDYIMRNRRKIMQRVTREDILDLEE